MTLVMASGFNSRSMHMSKEFKNIFATDLQRVQVKIHRRDLNNVQEMKSDWEYSLHCN